jgi:hypothetical protein
MQINVTEDEMRSKINYIEGRLQLLDKALKEEMAKPFFKRNRPVVSFIYIERKIYLRLLEELKCILYA